MLVPRRGRIAFHGFLWPFVSPRSPHFSMGPHGTPPSVSCKVLHFAAKCCTLLHFAAKCSKVHETLPQVPCNPNIP